MAAAPLSTNVQILTQHKCTNTDAEATFDNKQMPAALERRQRLGDRDETFEQNPGAWRTAQVQYKCTNTDAGTVQMYKY